MPKDAQDREHWPHFAEAVETLTLAGNPRVWSLIVTLLGDMYSEPDFEIPAPTLARILARLGVNGAAMRVAVHRLKNDAWIVARRCGRSSVYSLHASRFDETAQAAARIFSFEPGRHWALALTPPSAPAIEDAGIIVSPSLTILPSVPSSDQAVPPSDPPDWLREAICPSALMQAYSELERSLEKLVTLTESAPRQGGIEAVALRLMVLHAWRRVILRHPDLPDEAFPRDWPGTACRAFAQLLFDRLPRPTSAQLAEL